jgi:cell division protein FtsL
MGEEKMIWFTILVISLIFCIAISDVYSKVHKLETEIKFLQADIRIQQKVNESNKSNSNT